MNQLTKAISKTLFFFLVVVAAGLFVIGGTASATGSLVYIEPGHGGSDPGAIGVGGFYEKTINLAIASKLNAILQANGYQTVMSRFDDATEGAPNPWEDIHMDQANAMGADIFLSIHNNASSFSSASGTETWYSTKSLQDIIFAGEVQNHMLQAIRGYGYNTVDRGLWIAPTTPPDGPWMITRGNMPAVLIEGLFVTNPSDASVLVRDDFQWVLATGLYNAIAHVLPPAVGTIQFPLFRWNSIQGAVDYEVEVLDVPPELNEEHGTMPSVHRIDSFHSGNRTVYLYDARPLKAGTYYYRAIAIDQSDAYLGGYSDTDTFEVPKVILNSAYGGMQVSAAYLSFSWMAIPTAVDYGVEILNAPPETDEANGKTPSIHRIAFLSTYDSALTYQYDMRLLTPGTYYYRVIAEDRNGFISGFSDGDSFELTATAPPAIASDVVIYRTGSYPNWFFRVSSNTDLRTGTTSSLFWGNAGGEQPLVGDFDNNGRDDVLIFRRTSYPNWFANLSLDSGAGSGKDVWTMSFGNSSDNPLTGDFDGDGKTDLAIHRDGSYPNWFFKLSSDTGFTFGTSSLSFGNPSGDKALVGDFNGDDRDDIAIYRYGSYPNWFVLLNSSPAPGSISWGGIWPLSWGNPGRDTPLISDINGDGWDDVGIYRYGFYPNWFILFADKAGGSGFVNAGQTVSASWGNPGGDLPIVGNFDGLGSDDIGVYRTGSYPNWYFKVSGMSDDISTGPTWAFSWGNPGGDTPIIGDFNGE